jgi:hypothetical protein
LAVVLSVTASLSTGCAGLRTHDRAPCSWIDVGEQPGLTASGKRRLMHGHEPPHMCGTVDTFRVERPNYVLELWNGEEDMRLFLRASSPQGLRLRLDSAELEQTDVHGQTAYFKTAMAFDYVFLHHRLVDGRPRSVEFPYTLSVSVMDGSGAVIGRESLRLFKRVGSYRFGEM